MSARERFYTPPQQASNNTAYVLVELPAGYIDHTLLGLQQFLNQSRWISENDYLAGYNGVAETMWRLLEDMSTQIVQSVDRVYMLIDQALNGREYTEAIQPDGTIGPVPALPIVPSVPADGIGLLPGLRRQMLEAQGTVPAGFFGLFPRPATTADLLYASRINNATDEGIIPDGIQEIALAVSQGASIADALAGFLGGTASAATDKGLAAANIGMLGLLATQIGALSVGLQSTIDAITLQTERLTYLTGSVPPTSATIGANGLPNWLSAGFGSLTELNNEGTYLLARLALMGQSLGAIQQSSSEINDKSNNLAVIATRLAQLLGIEAVGDPIIANSLLVLAECICQNVTAINEKTPAQPEPEPGPANNNPEPAFSCVGFAGLPKTLCNGWTFYGTSNDGNSDLYFTTFPGLELNLGISNVDYGTVNNIIGYKISAGKGLETCFTWDTTGYTNQVVWSGWTNTSSQSATLAAAFPSFGNWPTTMGVENEQNQTSQFLPADTGDVFLIYSAAVQAGTAPPPTELWASWIVSNVGG